MTEISIPKRNRDVKSLLWRTYGVGVSVKAGRGTAHHWIEVEFLRVPHELQNADGRKRDQTVTKLIREAGIHISTYNSDGDHTGDCIEVKFPRREK